jgi:hypothetical protein
MFDVAQVRQALQQVVAIGAASLYLTAACSMRPCQTCFTGSV